MSAEDDLNRAVAHILNTPWDTRQGRVVPETEQVKFDGGAVKLDATVLYADLAMSSRLATNFHKTVAAKVFRCFLHCATKILTMHGGQITSFDGDRVMAVFLGDHKNTMAVTAALKINYTVKKIISPYIRQYFESLKGFLLFHAVGIDTSEVLTVRAGQRKSNDLIWIGRAPNLAAYLSSIRKRDSRSYISKEVFRALRPVFRNNPELRVWKPLPIKWLGKQLKIYRSNRTLIP